MSAATIGTATVAALIVVVLAAPITGRLASGRVLVAGECRRSRRSLGRRRPTSAPTADEVAVWCEFVARELRSGSSLPSAIAAGGSTDSTMVRLIGPVVHGVRRGESLVVALDAADVDPASAAGLAFTVLRSCARFGGPAAVPLERAAATLRARDAVAAEQQAQSAQARLSARVLTLVPVALLVILTATDAKVRGALTTPAGATAVVLGGVFNGAGALWMRRIIGRPR
ncbi:MAG TPA: type II secretion system F family protein [Desertimonas sp.]|nr:type II secretion system F family protein [Desertimonas sp.]